MTPLEVLSMIRQAGGTVNVADGDLRIKAPKGLLKPDHKAILAEHKTTLLRLLAPPVVVAIVDQEERKAIQWLETLPSDHAAIVLGAAAQEWTQLVDSDSGTIRPWWWSSTLTDNDNRVLDEFMGYDVERRKAERPACEPTADAVVIRAEVLGGELRLVCPTPEIQSKIEAGRPQIEKILAGIMAEQQSPDEFFEEIDPPSPCQKCGSLGLWETLADTWRCLRCDPPIKAERWAAKAKQLREKTRIADFRTRNLLDKVTSNRYHSRSRSRIAARTGSSPQTTLVRRVTHG